MMFISKDAQCYDRSYCIHEFFLCNSQFLSYCPFCILQQLTVTWTQRSVVGFAKYAVNSNLIQLCSSILGLLLENDLQTPLQTGNQFFFQLTGYFPGFFFLSKVMKFTCKMRNVLKRMKNQFLRLLVFEIWSMLYSKSANFR